MSKNRSPEIGLYAGIIVGYAVGLTIAMAIVDHLQRRRDERAVQLASAEHLRLTNPRVEEVSQPDPFMMTASQYRQVGRSLKRTRYPIG